MIKFQENLRKHTALKEIEKGYNTGGGVMADLIHLKEA